MNLPNRLTVGRLFISIIYFVILSFAYKDGVFQSKLLDISSGLFIIALLTDALDGYLARRYKMVTNFGRIADPFIDKVLICGSFIFFVSWGPMHDFMPTWMVVVILAREFLVSGLRAFAESKGIAFGSSFWGQNKMTTQGITIIWILVYFSHLKALQLGWTSIVFILLVWLTFVITVFSGLSYLIHFYRLRKNVIS